MTLLPQLEEHFLYRFAKPRGFDVPCTGQQVL